MTIETITKIRNINPDKVCDSSRGNMSKQNICALFGRLKNKENNAPAVEYSLLADLLIWTCGQHFYSFLVAFAYICVCTQIIIILIFSLSADT